jgi:hypothetical protein
MHSWSTPDRGFRGQPRLLSIGTDRDVGRYLGCNGMAGQRRVLMTGQNRQVDDGPTLRRNSTREEVDAEKKLRMTRGLADTGLLATVEPSTRGPGDDPPSSAEIRKCLAQITRSYFNAQRQADR